MKKILSILFAAISLISCSNDEDFSQKNTATTVQTNQTASKLSSGTNVKLYKAWVATSQRYGFAQFIRKFQVEVNNLGYDKKVVIMHKMSDGTWKDFPLTYLSSSINNTEIWSGEFSIFGSFYEGAQPFVDFGTEFVVRYEINGQKYWDNNNGQNYVTGYYDKGNKIDYQGMMLRSDINLSVNTYNSSINKYDQTSNRLYLSVDVRNISPTKEVTVVYSGDGWKTTKTAPLSYSLSYYAEQYNYLSGTNHYGIERWSTDININTVSAVEYAVVYKVNGVEYWDNNFGKNYTIKSNQ